MVLVDREGAITVTTNVSGAAVKVVSGSAVAAEANTGDGTTTTTKKVPVGSYELIVSKEGYKDARKTIVVNGDINESIELEKIATATTATVKAIGSKKIQVTYDGAVDPAKAKVSVKKGAVETDIESTTFSEDKTVATIETKARLIKGDYTITTAGVTEKDIVATLTAEDEKVAKIDVTTKTAPYIPEKVTEDTKEVTVKRKASVDFVVLNQYGEDVTATYGGNISWTSSTSDAVDTSKASKGNLIISNGKNDFVPGNKVYITGVYAQGGVAVNAEVTIGVEKKADEVIFKGVYNKTTKKIESLPAGFKNGKYVLLFDVKDQYGNKMDAADITGSVTGDNGSLVFTSDNPLFIASDIKEATSTFDVDDKTYLGVDLTAGTMAAKGGKATIQVISKVTGKISKYEINAESLSQVKTMTISAPQSISVVNEVVEIPFSAVDQNGNAVTNYKQLKEQMTLTASDGRLYFKEADDGSAKLMFDALGVKGANDTVDAPVYLSTMVTDGGNFSNVLINVKAAARPVAVVGVDKNTATSIARGGSVVIKAENVLLQDQYGRTMDPKIVKGMIGDDYKIKVESELPTKNDVSPFTVSGNNVLSNLSATVTYGSDAKEVTITKPDAVAGSNDIFAVQIASKGNNDLDDYNKLNSAEKISFSLLKYNENSEKTDKFELVAGSEKVVTFSKVAQSEFVKYEADDLGVMYNDAKDTKTNTAYNKTVNVYGIKEDGTKVAIPKEYFKVTTDAGDDKLLVTENVISDVANGFKDTDFRENGATEGKVITKTVKVSIAVKDYVTGAIVTTLTKDLVLSKDDPKIATIGFKSEKDDNEHFVDKAKATTHANSGIIKDLSEYINADDVKDQYGVKNADGIKKDVAITISDIARGDESAFTVTENGTKEPVISGAVLGDKFKVTYSYAGGKSEVVNFTVGADNTPNWKLENTNYATPELEGDPIKVVDGKLTAASTNTLTFKNALVNASKTAIVDALKTAFTDTGAAQAKATYAWNEDGTELTVTVGSSPISGIASGDVTCDVTNVFGKKASVVILSSRN